MNTFSPFIFEAGLFVGNPFEDGIELTAVGYHRAEITEVVPAFYGQIWGVVNRNPIQFPTAGEDWKCTHVGFIARGYDIKVSAVPISDAVLFADPVVSALGASEEKTISAGHSVVLAPGSIFMAASLVGEALDFSGFSKCVN